MKILPLSEKKKSIVFSNTFEIKNLQLKMLCSTVIDFDGFISQELNFAINHS